MQMQPTKCYPQISKKLELKIFTHPTQRTRQKLKRNEVTVEKDP